MDKENHVAAIMQTALADGNEIDSNALSLEALVLLVKLERLSHLQSSTEENLKEVQERQKYIAEMHDLLKEINNALNESGEIEALSDELKSRIADFAEYGIEIDVDKTELSSLEAERLIANIQMTIDDLNVQNDMQLQTISRLTNERYECYQMARSILKPLHDAKLAHARGVAGR